MTDIGTTKYIKKNGEVCVYTYNVDRKKHNSTWYEKHKDDIKNNKIDCPCGLSYLVTNKSNHSKGRVHKLYLKYTEISTEQQKTEIV
jgi:hypothetical protein